MELACNKDVREPGRQLARFPQYCFKIEKPAPRAAKAQPELAKKVNFSHPTAMGRLARATGRKSRVVARGS